MSWIYKEQLLTDELIPEKSLGFIYLITHIPTNRKYIGKKNLTRIHRTQKNKKIIRKKVDSDWKEYWSSSPELNELVEQEGIHNFTREVLIFCPSKSSMMYTEECLQYSLGVLESEDWINRNIRSRIYKKNIINKVDVAEMRIVIETIKGNSRSG